MQYETTDTLSDYAKWTKYSIRFRKNTSEIEEFKSNIVIKNGNHERHFIDRIGSSRERIKGARIMSKVVLQLLNKNEDIHRNI